MKKRLYLVIFSLLLTITLVACNPKKTYKLTLPEFVTSDVSDPDKVLEETLVTLTVSEREGFVLDELKANGALLNVTNNKASFVMKADTEISVSFSVVGEEIYYKLILPEFVTSNVSDPLNILKGTEVTLTVEDRPGYILSEFKINDLLINITNNKTSFIMDNDKTVTVLFNKETEGTYYKLTLAGHVTANITNLDKILAGTKVIIKVTLPVGKTIDSFYINDEIKELNNNLEIEVLVDKNLVVRLTLKDAKPLDEVGLVLLFKNLNPRIIKTNQVNYFDLIINNNEESEVNLSYALDYNENIDQRLFHMSYQYSDEDSYFEMYGKDGIFYQTDSYQLKTTKTDLKLTDSMITYLINNLGNFGGLSFHPDSINDVFQDLFNNFKENITEGEILKRIKTEEVGNTYNLSLELGFEDIEFIFSLDSEGLFGDLSPEEILDIKEQYKNISFNIALSITNNNIEKFKVEFDFIDIKGSFKYGYREKLELKYIEVLDAVSENNEDLITINIYDNNTLLLTSKVHPEQIHIYLEESFYYKKGYYISGLYSDEDLLIKFDPEKDIKSVTNIYFEYTEIKTIDEYRLELTKDVFGYLENNDNIYLETPDYILYLTYETIFVYDIKVKKGYYQNYEGEYYLIDGDLFIKENVTDFKKMLADDFLLLGNNYINIKNPAVNIMANGLINNGYDEFRLLNEEQITEILNFDINDFLSNNFKVDLPRDIYLGYSYFHDLDYNSDFLDLEVELFYNSYNAYKTTISNFISDYGLEIIYPKEEGYQIIVIHNDDYHFEIEVLAYKSSKGLALYNGHELRYLSDLDSLLDLSDRDMIFAKLSGVMIDNYLFNSLEELKTYNKRKVAEYYLEYEILSLSEVLTLLQDETIITYEFMYDMKNDILFYQSHYEPYEVHLGLEKYVIKTQESTMSFDKNKNGELLLRQYFKEKDYFYRYNFDDILTVIKILKGEIILDKNIKDNIYSNGDFDLYISEFRLYISNKDSTLDLMFEINEAVYESIDIEFAENSKILNNLNDDVIEIEYNNYLELSYNYFNFIEGYQVRIYDQFENENSAITNSQTYRLIYKELINPNEYLTKLSLEKAITIENDYGYKYKIIPGKYMELFIGGELQYVIEKVDDEYITFVIFDNNIYIKPQGTFLLNIIEFIDVYKNAEFTFVDGYYVGSNQGIKYLDDVYFSTNTMSLRYDGRYYDINFNDIKASNFEKADLTGYTHVNKRIKTIEFLDKADIKDVLSGKYQFNVFFNWDESSMMTISELIENFEISYIINRDGFKLTLTEDNITTMYSFNIFDIELYGPIIIFSLNYEEEVIYLDKLKDYVIEEMLDGRTFVGFEYRYEFYNDKESLLNQLKKEENETIHQVFLRYEYKSEEIQSLITNLLTNNYLEVEENGNIYYFDLKNNHNHLYLSKNNKYYDVFEHSDFYEVSIPGSKVIIHNKDFDYQAFMLNKIINELLSGNLSYREIDNGVFYAYRGEKVPYLIININNNLIEVRDLNTHQYYQISEVESFIDIEYDDETEFSNIANIYFEDNVIAEVSFNINDEDLYMKFMDIIQILEDVNSYQTDLIFENGESIIYSGTELVEQILKNSTGNVVKLSLKNNW